jgi:hypothetical protein
MCERACIVSKHERELRRIVRTTLGDFWDVKVEN